MARRETLEDFDIYHELVDLRLNSDVRRAGRSKYLQTSKLLGGYATVPEEVRETIARGESQKAEAKYLADWRRGKHRYPFGLGIGVRALLHSGRNDLLAETFVPDPAQLGAPEVVEVELPGSDLLLTGLILPNGTFEYGHRYSFDSDAVTFYQDAQQFTGEVAVGLSSGSSRTFLPHVIVSISDSGGAYWEPSAVGDRNIAANTGF